MKTALLLVQLVTHDTPQDLSKVCGDVAGCAKVYGQVCEVHVLPPAIGYPQDYEVIGHEFWHCYHGGFH